MTEYLARLRPGSGADRYNISGKMFYASKGWYKVSESLARKLIKEPTNILNPSGGGLVFEVKTKDEAREIEVLEHAKVAPAGTVDEPVLSNDTSGDMTSALFDEKPKVPVPAPESPSDPDMDDEPPEHELADESDESDAQPEQPSFEDEEPDTTREPASPPKPSRKRSSKKKVAKRRPNKS